MRQGWQELTIGGVPQWVSLRGPAGAPVLLFLHGGPGASEYGARRSYLGALERSWRVVEWEQRGAGRSFRGEGEPLDLDLLISDGVALVERLCANLRVDEVTLVGHSFGTVLGVEIALRAPRRLAAYVGVSQVVNWALQERRSYDWALERARATRDANAIAALGAIGPPTEGSYATGVPGTWVQREWLGRLGGVSARPGFMAWWMLSLMTCPSYPLTAKLRFQRAMKHSMERMWTDLGRRIDFARDVRSLAVPVWLFAGALDRITDLPQIEAWYQALSAPDKHLEVLADAGHLNLYENPDRFLAFMDGVRGAAAAKAA